jgi:acyl-CoA hydrolase
MKIKETKVTAVQYVMPEYSNPIGTLYGGRMMNWMVLAGTIAATKVAKGFTVLGSLDSLYFLEPVKVGYNVILNSQVEYVSKSSMEVSVDVILEDSESKIRKFATKAFMSYIAVDRFGRPRIIENKIEPDEDEKDTYLRAMKRKEVRNERLKDRKEKIYDVSLLEDFRWRLTNYRLVMPEDAFQGNMMFAGKLLMYIDEVASILASRYSKGICVTGSLEKMEFYAPIRVGDIITLDAVVSCVWNTSLEIKVKVIAETPFENIKRHICTVNTVFVNIDKQGKPSKLPMYLPETPAEKLEYEIANLRRKNREIELKEIKEMLMNLNVE